MLNRLLGEGSYGFVIKCKHPIHGVTAVKIIAIRKGENGTKLREAEIAQNIKHDNIVKYLDYKNDADLKLYPVKIRNLLQQKFEKIAPLSYFHVHMEYCNAGTLQDWIVSIRNGKRNLQTADGLFSQILEAVAVLHQNGIVHGDLKPQNIYLHKTTKSDTLVKIGDFGESFLEVEGIQKKVFGTLLYKPMAKHNEERITREYDMYAVGLIYSILFMGSVLNFDTKLVCDDVTRQKVLHQNLKCIQQCGSSELIKKTHPKREHFVKQLIANNGRPDAGKTKEKFSMIVDETNFKFMSSPVPGKNPFFQGRQSILQQINESSSIYILLYGLTETGKKTIAAEFIHSKSESNTFQEVFWFNCSSKRILKKQYHDLRARKKLKGPSLNSTVLNWLNTQPGLVIVYENVNDFSKFRGLMATNRSCGRVICTSQIISDDWPEDFYKIKVDSLPRNDCTRVIHETFEIINNQNEIPTEDEIAAYDSACIFLSNHLGYSTTALVYILVHLRRQNSESERININSLSEYVKDCQQRTYKLKRMQHDVIKLAKVETKLLPIISRLKAASSMACKWLKLCAYLDPQHIPEFLFDNFLIRDKGIQLKNEIMELVGSYSLLEYRNSNNGSFKVSSIVQRTVQMHYESSFKETILDLLTALNIPYLRRRRTKKVLADRSYKVGTLQPHYESISSHVSEYIDQLISRKPLLSTCCPTSCKKEENLKEMLLGLQMRLIRSYKSQSLREEKKKALNEIIILNEDSNNDDRLGTFLMSKAKMVRAKLILERIPTSAVSVQKEMMDLLQKAEKNFEKCNSHKNLIQCYFYQAECYTLVTGRYDYYYDATQNEERKQRDCSLARDYLNKALKLILIAVQKRTNLLRELCTALKKFAEIYSHLEDWEMVEKYLMIAFEFCLLKNVNEVNDNLKLLYEIDTYSVTDEKFENTLNQWTRNPRGAQDVLKTFRCCYERQNNSMKANFVEEIRKQCISTTSLGGAFLPKFRRLQEKLPKKCYETILEDLQSVENKKRTINEAYVVARNKICQADLEKRQEKIKDAIVNYNEALNIFLQQKQGNDLSIALIYEKLGECYSHYSESEKACEMFEKCYKIFKSSPNMKMKTNKSFADLIRKYVNQMPVDKIQEKISLLEECVVAFTSRLGRLHTEVGFTKEKIGSLFMKLGNFKSAEKVLKEALEIFEKNLPLGNQNRITCLEKLYKVCEKNITYRYEGDEATKYQTQYDDEFALKDHVNGNHVVKKAKVQKRKRTKLVQNEKKVESIMNGTFK